MNINDRRKPIIMEKFGQIKVSECFIDEDGDVNIKAIALDDDIVFAVCLKSGERWSPSPDDKYQIISASVVIE